MPIIKENMLWPPMGLLEWKMAEHSAWYSGDAEILANFYTEYARVQMNLLNTSYETNKETFWGRQIQNQGDIYVHVPIAGDIAETSANFLFAESPIIRLVSDNKNDTSHKQTQKEFDKLRSITLLDSKLLEAAESAAAISGIYIKLAWDDSLSPYPIPVIEQADKAIPEFRFGILTAVTFWKVIEKDESNSKVYRLLERYEKGSISYSLYLGTGDRLGKKISLDVHPETADMEEVIETVDELLVVYVPNMLPNRLLRASNLGRSDYSGIEGLMDSLDETFSCWMRDIVLAQAKILIPEQFLSKSGDKFKYNLDQMLYVQLDVDPITMQSKNVITPQQFDIRAEKFEKTAINLLERIISSAGYSPQSFGLSIEGRAESGTALSLRERKSFATKGKKEKYWNAALDRLVRLILLVYKHELKGSVDTELDINIEFNDGITNNLQELATSVQMLNNAQAVSTETKVRLLHPEWEEEQILTEVQRILDENRVAVPDIFPNLDAEQIDYEGTAGEE